jgi:hypothetical protein
MVQENYGVLEVYVLYLLNMMHYPYSLQAHYFADSQAKPNHMEASVLCKVLGTLRMIFMKLVQVFLNKWCLYFTQVLIGYLSKGVNIIGTKNSSLL